MADFDGLQEEVLGLSRDGNITDVIKPRKSILKVRENTTLPISTGVSMDARFNRRVSFAEKVKLHKIDFVPVDMQSDLDGLDDMEGIDGNLENGLDGLESEWPEPLSSSEDDEPSFSNLEADADKVLTALGSSLSEKILGSLPDVLSDENLFGDQQNHENHDFEKDYDYEHYEKDFGKDNMGLGSDDEKTMELTEQISRPNPVSHLKDTMKGDLDQHNENGGNENENEGDGLGDFDDLQEEDMEFTGQVQDTRALDQSKTDFEAENGDFSSFNNFNTFKDDSKNTGPNFSVPGQKADETMDFTEYYSGPNPLQNVQNDTHEETMDFTQLAPESGSGNYQKANEEFQKEPSPIIRGPQPDSELDNDKGIIEENASNDHGKKESAEKSQGCNVRAESEEYLSAESENEDSDPEEEVPMELTQPIGQQKIEQDPRQEEQEDRKEPEQEQEGQEKSEPEQMDQSEHSEQSKPEHSEPEQPESPKNSEEPEQIEQIEPVGSSSETIKSPETPPNESVSRISVQLQSPVKTIISNLESIPEQTEDEMSTEISTEMNKAKGSEKSEESDEKSEENMNEGNVPSRSEGKSPKRKLQEGLQTSPKRHSSYITEVNTTTIPLAGSWTENSEDEDYPILSLEEFLQEIGIKFYDDLEIATDLSSQYRMSPSSQEQFDSADYYRANIQIPLLEVYELSCKELAGKIQQGKLLFEELQQKTLSDNPDLFRQYQKASFYERVAMKSQFHLMRELTRQQAKQVWYEWRSKLFRNIIEVFQTNLNILQDDKATFVENMNILNEKSRETKQKLHGLQTDISRFKAMKANFKTLESEQIESIKARMTELNVKLSAHRDLILARKKAIGAVEDQIKQINENITAVEKESAKAQADLNNTKHFNDSEIEGLQTEAKLLEACAGLKYLSSPSQNIYEFEFNQKMNIVIDVSRPESTEGLLFRPKNSPDAVLYNETLMDSYCQYLAENTPFSNIYDTLRTFKTKWTKLLSLDEDLHKLSLKGPVRIDSSDLKHINFELDLYVFSKKLKVTLSGSMQVAQILAYPDSVTWSARVHRGGGMSEAEVKQTICECWTLASFPTLRGMKMS